MGLWDSIKNAALKAKCTIGIHGGSYKVIEGETCKYSKVCPDCHETIKTEKHQFGNAEYKFEYKCVTVKKCLKCGIEQEGEKHEQYVDIDVDDYCNVKQRCMRCHSERVHGKQHSWFSDGSTDTHHLYKCLKCGASSEKRKVNFKAR
ncbi:hypothetical protein [Mixta calida]|uniref:hypothetical protein n=1 Tax=Mixta calida TaxID=665913 RepID=UPI001056C595|nr:hypothetical protein [Mixta calida]MBS6058452.1 hypothetical protein [Pantoea sp.]MDU3075434.1 hypothetical protein [Mixta calida]MDU3818114.1 hypothetical protein [Pantoea sp.]MDU4290593.1 hypothetical protein [Mixta calida]MDU5767656.1 hypothetical protein [Mixta calida]